MTPEVLTDLRAIWGELFPHRDPEHWTPTDGELVVAIYAHRLSKTTRCETRYAEGVGSRLTAQPRGKR